MILLALLLLLIGVVVGLLGNKLFKVFLPIVGVVAGTMVGFVGFQGVFGTGAVSTTVAVLVAVATGLLLGLLSFLFFEIALTVYTALLGASALTYLGVALGLGENGFVLFLLSVAGFVLGLSIALSRSFSTSIVIGVTSLVGGAFILASVFLLVGQVSFDQLYNQGVVRSVLEVVDQSFLWLFVWLAGSVVAMHIQSALATMVVLDDQYAFKTGDK